MSAALAWRTLTEASSPRFCSPGTELSVALCGTARRFAVYEVRCLNSDGFADREYVIRDAEAISDADLRAGKRPPVVGRTQDYDKVAAFAARSISGPAAR